MQIGRGAALSFRNNEYLGKGSIANLGRGTKVRQHEACFGGR